MTPSGIPAYVLATPTANTLYGSGRSRGGVWGGLDPLLSQGLDDHPPPLPALHSLSQGLDPALH